MAEQVNSPQITPPAFEFRETPKLDLCTSLSCANGHIWPSEVQVTQCPGCKSPILAIKMVNCPQCNEPSAKLALRADHLSRGQAITAICAGSATMAETHKIELKLQHAVLEQEKHVVREMPGKL